jgi:hypothetical protein
MECTMGDCSEPVYAKGLCRKHYERNRKHGDPLYVGKPGPAAHQCDIPDCGEPCVGGGLCRKHYMRLRRNGDPLATKRVIGDDEARWWSHVDRRGDGECWPWTAFIDDKGYGRFWLGDRLGYAPRWGYEHFVGPLPYEEMPDHTCHDPRVCTVPHLECPHRACVNWHHLEPVTNRVNCLRGARTKLSDATVAVLYDLWRRGAQADVLALSAGVNKTTLYRRFHRLERTQATG